MFREAGKRGKLDAKPLMTGHLSQYMKSSLPVPPKSFDYAHRVNEFPMALNDTYGDCTIAGVVHMLQLLYAEIGETFVYPGDEAVKETYFQLSGGADNGLVEQDVLQAWMTKGLFGTQIVAYAPIKITNQRELAAACYAFGAIYLGVQMPDAAEQQFENGQPWHLTGNDAPPTGGHCIVASGANSFGVDMITWGAEDSFTWDWWKKYGSEAWVVIPEAFVEINHGPVSTIDIMTLRKDLQSL